MKTETIVKIRLFGKTGRGLSATRNSILGKQVFKSVYNPSQPTTKKVSSDYKEYKNFQLKVVDASTVSAHELIKDKEMTFKSKNVEQDTSLKSFDITVFVMRFGERFSKEEEKILKNLENIYGRKVYDHMIVVMTGGEQFTYAMKQEGGLTNFQEWCSQQEGRFQKLYQDCGRRVVLLDNRNKMRNKKKQTREIEKLVEELVEKLKVNHGSLQVHVSGRTEPARTEIKAKFNLRGKGSEIFVSKSQKWSITSKLWIVFLLLMIEFCHSTPTLRHLCHPGTYVHTTRNNKNLCQPCPDGTFMPHSLHTHTTCYSCTQIRDQNLEVLKTECSKTRNAEILCTPGYYRRRAWDVREVDRCEKCYECEHPTLTCQDYHDTVCCGHTNYDAVLNNDGVYECKERPILCDPGQFLNQETEECTPCPPGTFMSEFQHDSTICNSCTTVSDLKKHEIISDPCISTHDSRIICEKEFFMETQVGWLGVEVRCLPCQKCEYQGRECDMYHDRVCCDHPDMMVVNTSSGYQCIHRPTTTSGSQIIDFLQRDDYYQRDNFKEDFSQVVCGNNTYFSPASTTCLSCEKGTYMDKSSHTERVCKICSQIQGSYVPKGCPGLTEDLDTNETYKAGMISAIVILLLIIVGVGVRGCVYCIRKRKRPQKDKPLGIAAYKDKPMRKSGSNNKLGLCGSRIRLLSKLSNLQELSENTEMI